MVGEILNVEEELELLQLLYVIMVLQEQDQFLIL
jgi:hypothetical protein